jgi:hypothetical protein
MTTGKSYDFLLKQMKDRESGVESLESTSQEPEVVGKGKTNLESRVETEEPEAKTPGHASQESRIEKEESSGLESRVKTEESEVKSPDKISPDSRVESLDYSALDEAIEEARKKPKLGVYSPVVAAMLRYKAITTPRYSMGSEIKAIVEQALKGAYPELYEEVQKRMNS